MIALIPLSQSESNYSQIITLDDTDYILDLMWNERNAHWFATLRDASGSDIATGIKLVTDIPWLAHEADDRMPPGAIWIVDTTGSETDPGLRDLGSRVAMVYIDEDSLA